MKLSKAQQEVVDHLRGGYSLILDRVAGMWSLQKIDRFHLFVRVRRQTAIRLIEAGVVKEAKSDFTRKTYKLAEDWEARCV